MKSEGKEADRIVHLTHAFTSSVKLVRLTIYMSDIKRPQLTKVTK